MKVIHLCFVPRREQNAHPIESLVGEKFSGEKNGCLLLKTYEMHKYPVSKM
jgi:hypothetical protein